MTNDPKDITSISIALLEAHKDGGHALEYVDGCRECGCERAELQVHAAADHRRGFQLGYPCRKHEGPSTASCRRCGYNRAAHETGDDDLQGPTVHTAVVVDEAKALSAAAIKQLEREILPRTAQDALEDRMAKARTPEAKTTSERIAATRHAADHIFAAYALLSSDRDGVPAWADLSAEATAALAASVQRAADLLRPWSSISGLTTP